MNSLKSQHKRYCQYLAYEIAKLFHKDILFAILDILVLLALRRRRERTQCVMFQSALGWHNSSCTGKWPEEK